MSRGQAYLAPLLLATGLIVNAYAPSHSHWSVMLRPGVLVLAATAVVTTVLLMTMRRPMVAAAGACLLLLIAYEWRVGLLIALLVGLFLAFRRIVMHRHEAIPAQALLVPVALFLAIGVARAIGTGTVTPADVFVPRTSSAPARTEAQRPNVYLLLLDGYPRQDTLATDFGYDNEPFLEELEELGFMVNRQAVSTFAHTELSLGSMQFASLDELRPFFVDGEFGPEPRAEPRDVRREFLVNTDAMDALRDLGYRLAYVPPPVGDVDWAGWDDRWDPGQMTEFEAALLQQTPIRSLLGGWLLEQARDRIAESLRLWASPIDGQHLTFAHLMAPHPPFLWDASGEVDRPIDCWLANTCSFYAGFGLGMSVDDYATRVGPQVAALNEQLLTTIRGIVAEDPSAIIVAFSDHGTRYRSEASTEARRILFAARGTRVTEIEGLLVDLTAELAAER